MTSYYAIFRQIWIKLAGRVCRGPGQVISYTRRIYDFIERVYDVILRHFPPFIDRFGSNLQEWSVVVRDRFQAITGVSITSPKELRSSYLSIHWPIWIKLAGRVCRGLGHVIRYKWRIYDVIKIVYDVIFRHLWIDLDQTCRKCLVVRDKL